MRPPEFRPPRLAAVALAAACTRAAVAAEVTTRPATARSPAVDARSFDLRPEPPPVPALTYQLAFDPADRRPGTAAAAYLQAAVLLTDDEQTQVDKARDATDVGDWAAFDRATDALFGEHGHATAVLDRLDDAGRREISGLDAAWRDEGLDATLAQLNPIRAMANLLYVRACRQSRDGRPADAVATLRLGYRLAHDVADGTPIVCGLVGLAVAATMDHGLAGLMNRPDAPNLYWALATLPRPVVDLRRVMDGERRWQARMIPGLARARSGGITADDWPPVTGPYRFLDGPPAALAAAAADFVRARPEVGAYYGRVHQVDAAAVAKADPRVVMATFMVGRFQAASDEMLKWVDQPYPVLLPRMRALPAELRRLGLADLNLFATAAPSYVRPVEAFARGDRMRAALTAVEALRSYAAAHGGRLPNRLADVTDTPVPDNPVTGRPFEYRVAAGTATLGDHDPLLADHPLEYTVRIRRP